LPQCLVDHQRLPFVGVLHLSYGPSMTLPVCHANTVHELNYLLYAVSDHSLRFLTIYLYSTDKVHPVANNENKNNI